MSPWTRTGFPRPRHLPVHPPLYHCHGALPGGGCLANLPVYHHSLPLGAYYESGLEPVGIWIEDDYVRAVRGGMGFAKTGGNYAASLAAQVKAHDDGYPRSCGWTGWSGNTLKRWAP